MRNLTWLMLLLTACGSQGGGGSDNSPEVTAQGEPSPEQQQQVDTQYAQLVQDAASLPACDATTEGKLVYVKVSSEFEVCGGGAWAVIDLKGVVGEKGEKGDKGEKGEAGKDGEPGQAVYVDGEYWDDEITGLHWRLAGVGPNCPEGWRLPTLNEVGAASINGLFVVLGSGKIDAYKRAWSSTDYGGATGRVRWNFETGNRFNQGDGSAMPESNTTPTAAYCVKDS